MWNSWTCSLVQVSRKILAVLSWTSKLLQKPREVANVTFLRLDQRTVNAIPLPFPPQHRRRTCNAKAIFSDSTQDFPVAQRMKHHLKCKSIIETFTIIGSKSGIQSCRRWLRWMSHWICRLDLDRISCKQCFFCPTTAMIRSNSNNLILQWTLSARCKFDHQNSERDIRTYYVERNTTESRQQLMRNLRICKVLQGLVICMQRVRKSNIILTVEA